MGVRSHGFEPTQKHHAPLEAVAAKHGGRLSITKRAIGDRRGTTTFYESLDNISGSMLPEHANVRHDATRSYEVVVVTVEDAIASVPGRDISLVKMDIEGAEYAALDATSAETLRRVPQWIVEFHHDMLPGRTFADTRRHLRRFIELGFSVYTRDNVNFLFHAR